MILARSWPLGASTSTKTPACVICARSSVTSCWERLSQWMASRWRSKSLPYQMTWFTYLLMVLLQDNQLLLQRLDITLQVQTEDIGFIQNLSQPDNIRLHCLSHWQLILHPTNTGLHQRSTKFLSYFEAECLLDFEVLCSQTCVVNSNGELGVALAHVKDLEGNKMIFIVCDSGILSMINCSGGKTAENYFLWLINICNPPLPTALSEL